MTLRPPNTCPECGTDTAFMGVSDLCIACLESDNEFLRARVKELERGGNRDLPRDDLFTSNDPLQHIADKCEQYINANRIGDEEFHCILSYIWRNTDVVKARMKKLEAVREAAEKVWEEFGPVNTTAEYTKLWGALKAALDAAREGGDGE